MTNTSMVLTEDDAWFLTHLLKLLCHQAQRPLAEPATRRSAVGLIHHALSILGRDCPHDEESPLR
jgi:hypothetical protein